MSQNLQMMSAIRQGAPITLCGLTFYPILMENYEEFLSCKEAFTLRQGTLPAKYLSFDFLSALFVYDRDLIQDGEKAAGLFERVLRMLYLSLRIGYDLQKAAKSILLQEGRLSRLSFTQLGTTTEITPRMFADEIRPLIAMQNGLELPREEENVELVQAAEQKKTLSEISDLKMSTDDLIASVAYQSRVAEKEINGWTVREFENRRRAIDRDKRYMLCGSAEMSGAVTFKKGNPAPSWCFDRIDDSLGTIGTSELIKTLDGVAEQK